jgi:hypothetical protein
MGVGVVQSTNDKRTVVKPPGQQNKWHTPPADTDAYNLGATWALENCVK